VVVVEVRQVLAFVLVLVVVVAELNLRFAPKTLEPVVAAAAAVDLS
jgi:hypothetical protein